MASYYCKIRIGGKWVMRPIIHPNIDGHIAQQECECSSCVRARVKLKVEAYQAIGRVYTPGEEE